MTSWNACAAISTRQLAHLQGIVGAAGEPAAAPPDGAANRAWEFDLEKHSGSRAAVARGHRSHPRCRSCTRRKRRSATPW